MALTLVQAAKLSQDSLQRGVIESFVQASPVLDRIPMLTIEGNAYAYNVEDTLPGVEFRAVNSAYAESTGIVNQKTETLKILGGDADVDTFIVQTLGDLNEQRSAQTHMKVKALSYEFQDTFINGNTQTDANAFDGLKKRITGDQVVTADTNGLVMIGGGSEAEMQKFLDRMDDLTSRINGPVSALYMNNQVLSKLRSLGRRLHFYDQTTDDFGKTVSTYNGIPMLDIGKNAAGVDIIPQTETTGNKSDCSSIYAVKFGHGVGDGGVTGLTNGGVQVKDLGEIDAKPVYRTRIEFFTGLGVFAGGAAARLEGVRVAAS